MRFPQGVRESLKDWREATPFNTPGDWVFASLATDGKRPFWPDSMLTRHIQPVAESAGLGHIGRHTFRHSLSAWGKEAFKLEETKELRRHSNIQTTSDIYGACCWRPGERLRQGWSTLSVKPARSDRAMTKEPAASHHGD